MKEVITALRAAFEAAAAADSEAAPAYARLLDGIDWSAALHSTTPSTQPVVERWFETAGTGLRNGPMAVLGRAVLANADRLEWISIYEAYEDDPTLAEFLDSYAIIRLVSPHGPLQCENMTVALTLQGPNTFYPPHAHKQEEVYGVLAGTATWQRGAEPWVTRAPEAIFLHPGGVRHATRTAGEPLLSLACWTRDVTLPIVFVTA
jgi:mannose-6-phosphate isomerase-like protein (cupin superfamily)